MPRVHVIEGVNARYLEPEALPWQPDLLTMDVSFISVTKVLPAVVACMAPSVQRGDPHQAPVRGGPEGRGQGRHRARSRRAPPGAARDGASSFWSIWASSLPGCAARRCPGTGGNVEYFFHLERGGAKGLALDTLEAAIDAAVAAADARAGGGGRG